MIKIVNVYIVYEFYDWPKVPLKNLTLKNCLFGATNIVKNSDKDKWVFTRYKIAFDGEDWWSFGNGITKNLFGHCSSSSSNFDNLKNNFLILDLALTFGINGGFGLLEKKFCINFTKANTKCSFSLHYNGDNSYLFVNVKEIIRFKGDNKNVNFPTGFRLGSISDEFSATEFREVSLNGNMYFSIEYNSVDKSDMLNIHKYLMTKNNIK